MKPSPRYPRQAQPKRILDLESMAFSQGGHLFPSLTVFKASSGFILLRASTGAGKTSVTRKSTDTSYTNIVRLIVIDESATKVVQFWRTSSFEESVAWSKLTSICVSLDRHYRDAATFLLIDESKALFYFNASLRANSSSELLKRRQSSSTK